MTDSYVPSGDGLSPELGSQEKPPQYQIPLVTVQDQTGKQESFIPVLEPMGLISAFIETIDEAALKLTMTPGLTPEPDAEVVEAAREAIRGRVAMGYLNPEAVNKVDPVFQVKYEQNVNAIAQTMIDIAANVVAKRYQAEAEAKGGGRRIIQAGPGMIPPRNT